MSSFSQWLATKRAQIFATIALVAALVASGIWVINRPPISPPDINFPLPAPENTPSLSNKSQVCDPNLHTHFLSNTSSSDGTDRKITIYRPANAENRPLPVIFYFHGTSESGPNGLAAEPADLEEYAYIHNFMIVYPYAQERPSTNEIGWYSTGPKNTTEPGDKGHRDDAIFIDHLIAEVDSLPCTQSTRYAMGFSGGGGFSMSLACQFPTAFNATAVSHGAGSHESCEDAAPVPLIAILNEDDTSSLIENSEPKIIDYAKRNGCGDDIPDGGTTVTTDTRWDSEENYTFGACPSDADNEVIFYKLTSSSYTDEVSRYHRWLTDDNSNQHATPVIFDFFEKH